MMRLVVVKAIQRKVLDYVNRGDGNDRSKVRILGRVARYLGLVICMLPVYAVIFSMVMPQLYFERMLTRETSEGCMVDNDNIGGKYFKEVRCIPRIDAVYTWVNGSDPVWRAKMESFKAKMFHTQTEPISEANHSETRSDMARLAAELKELNQAIDSLDTDLYSDVDFEFFRKTQTFLEDQLHRTNVNLVAQEEEQNEEHLDRTIRRRLQVQSSTDDDDQEDEDKEYDASGDNRYRDNSELKYSLRSLEKYAPWIHHVYLVTDNQIPSWLDLSNPKLTLVMHTEIFKNKTHLPTFSSPAIEANLHRIPGLSRKFVYLNDDVMFGAPVFPDDFFTPSGGQKIYLSWDLPQCSDGCMESWIGDGYCDVSCNVSACNFDANDCAGKSLEDMGSNSGFGGYSNWNSGGLGQESAGKAPSCQESCPGYWMGDNMCDPACNTIGCAYDGLDCFDFVDDPEMETLRFPIFHIKDLHPSELIELPFGTRAVVADISNIQDDEDDEVVEASHNASEVITQASIRLARNLLVVVFGRPPDKALGPDLALNDTAIGFGENPETKLWKGASPSEYGADTGTCFSQAIPDTFIPGCDPYFGCERFLTLEIAKDICIARKSSCGGVVFNYQGKYETRASNGTQPSKLGEMSWLKTRKCENVPPQASSVDDSDKRNDRVIVNLQIKFKSEKAVDIHMTAGLPLSRKARVKARRRLGETLNREKTMQDLKSRWIQLYSKAKTLMRSRMEDIPIFQATDWGDGFVKNDPDNETRQKLRGKAPLRNDTNAKRRALDAYADSLVYTNQLFRGEFGSSNRKVPAHMAHFLDIEELEALQAHWAEHFERTSSSHFRSSTDIQFAFSYMYWIIHQANAPALTPREFFNTELDTDHNNVLDVNEVRTLAALMCNKDSIDAAQVDDNIPKLYACFTHSNESLARDEKGRTIYPSITYEDLERCNLAMETVRKNTRRKSTHQVVDSESEVAFEMIGDDLQDTLSKLDSIRTRKPKFICVNDDMKNPSKETQLALYLFYESMFARPSQFELPPTRRNLFLYYDEFLETVRVNKRVRVLSWALIALLLLLLLLLLVY